MRVFLGIDLGSTTTKAVVLDEAGAIIGRGITNSRSNYDVAAKIVREEAFVRTRFALLWSAAAMPPLSAPESGGMAAALHKLELDFRRKQYLEHLDALHAQMMQTAELPRHRAYAHDLKWRLDEIATRMREKAAAHYAPGAARKSDFFRDIAGADFVHAERNWPSRRGSRSSCSAGFTTRRFSRWRR